MDQRTRRARLTVSKYLKHPLSWAAAGLLLVAAALGAGWWYGAARFADAVDGWMQARRAEGWQIAAAGRRITGFPLRWSARFDSLALTPPPASGGAAPWSWQGHEVTIAWSLFDPSGLHVGARGTSSLDVASDGRKLPVLLDSDAIAVRLDLKPQPMQHATGSIAHLAASATDLTLSADRVGFDVSYDPQATPLDHRQVAVKIALEMDRLSATLPGQEQSPPPVSGSLSAALMGRPPAAPLPQAVAAWRDEGGTIEVERLHLQSGPVAVEGDGTLALDGEMRLIGAGTANISGFDQAIEQLVASGHLAARDAPLAKLGFTALAKPDPKTGVATVALPVTAENGFLYLGPLKIAALKPIRFE